MSVINYIKYLNNVLKNVGNGYNIRKLVLDSKLSELEDIAKDLDDMQYVDELLKREGGEVVFFKSYGFLTDNLYCSSIERLQKGCKSRQKWSNMESCCEGLLTESLDNMVKSNRGYLINFDECAGNSLDTVIDSSEGVLQALNDSVILEDDDICEEIVDSPALTDVVNTLDVTELQGAQDMLSKYQECTKGLFSSSVSDEEDEDSEEDTDDDYAVIGGCLETNVICDTEDEDSEEDTDDEEDNYDVIGSCLETNIVCDTEDVDSEEDTDDDYDVIGSCIENNEIDDTGYVEDNVGDEEDTDDDYDVIGVCIENNETDNTVVVEDIEVEDTEVEDDYDINYSDVAISDDNSQNNDHLFSNDNTSCVNMSNKGYNNSIDSNKGLQGLSSVNSGYSDSTTSDVVLTVLSENGVYDDEDDVCDEEDDDELDLSSLNINKTELDSECTDEEDDESDEEDEDDLDLSSLDINKTAIDSEFTDDGEDDETEEYAEDDEDGLDLSSLDINKSDSSDTICSLGSLFDESDDSSTLFEKDNILLDNLDIEKDNVHSGLSYSDSKNSSGVSSHEQEKSDKMAKFIVSFADKLISAPSILSKSMSRASNAILDKNEDILNSDE